MRRHDHRGARVLMVLALLAGMLSMGMVGSTAIAETGQQPRVQTDALALQAGRTDLAIRITSSDPAAVNTLGNPTTIRLSQAGTTRFSGSITNTPTIPREFNINPSGSTTFPQGSYLLEINAGPQFNAFSQTVNLNQTTQTLNVTLQVNDDLQELIDELIAILIQILQDILAMTPTAVPSTATATAVPSTATATAVPSTATATTGPGTSTATSVPATNTPTATATATQPPADLTTLTVNAVPSSVVTGGDSTVTVTVTGRTGPTGGRLVVTPAEIANAPFSNFVCSACSNDADAEGEAEFTYGANMSYTATFTFEVTSTTADTYTISVFADDELTAGDTLTRTDTVTFTVPTPTATATSTAVPTNTPTNTPTSTPTTAPTTAPTATATVAAPAPAITSLTVDSDETDVEPPETEDITVTLTGQASPAGSTVVLSVSRLDDGLGVSNVASSTPGCVVGATVVCAVTGAYTVVVTADVSVAANAANGATLTIRAEQDPGDIVETEDLTFTID